MTRAKAQKHLDRARETFEFWKDQYLYACRETSTAMDIRLHYLDKHTIREQKKLEAIEEMNDAKVRIARFERIVR